MLDICFITDKNCIKKYNISESMYEKLAKCGFDKVGTFDLKKICVEEEEDELEICLLNAETRLKYKTMLEETRHKELKLLFYSMDDSPTIKEIRKNFEFVKVLTELVDIILSEDNKYLWLGY